MNFKDYSKKFDPNKDDPQDHGPKRLALLGLAQALQTGREPFDKVLMPRELAERNFRKLADDMNRERSN